MSKIPIVFIINNATNQGLLSFLAAFQSAQPFQKRLQTNKGINRKEKPAIIPPKAAPGYQ